MISRSIRIRWHLSTSNYEIESEMLAIRHYPSFLTRIVAGEVADALLDVRVVHESGLLVERGAGIVGEVNDQVDDVAAECERLLDRSHEQLRADAASPLRRVHEQRVHAELSSARR